MSSPTQLICLTVLLILVAEITDVSSWPEKPDNQGDGEDWGTRGGDHSARSHRPPPEAIVACGAVDVEASCEFTTPRGNKVAGVCVHHKRTDHPNFCRPDQRARAGGDHGYHHGFRPLRDQQKQNSSISACEGLHAEDFCFFRPPVMGDQDMSQGKRHSHGKQMPMRKPLSGSRKVREGRCVPHVRQADGETINFCRPLPPQQATDVCMDRQIDASCSFLESGEATHVSLRAFTSKQAMSETSGDVLASFFIDGVWTDPELFFSGAQLGEEKAKVFTLAGWPTRVILTISSNDAWSFWKLVMNGTVLDEDPAGEVGSDAYSVSDDGSAFKDSRWWLEGPPSSQVLDVPYNNNAPEGPMRLRLKIYTSTSADAGTTGWLFASFLVDGAWTTPEAIFHGAGIGEDKTRMFTLNAWPSKVWVSINSVDAYSFWKIKLNDITLLEDPAGATGSQEYNALALGNASTAYWIESPPASQTFSVADVSRTGRAATHAVKGTCQEAWWDMMSGALHCRPFRDQWGSPKQERKVGAPNAVPPRWDSKRTVLSDAGKTLKIKIVVKNLDHKKLMYSVDTTAHFENRVKEAIADAAGEGIYKQHVSVELLSAGSVVIDATINPPAYIDTRYLEERLSSSQSLRTSLVTSIRAIPNINAIRSGTIEITEVHISTPSKHEEQGEETSSDSKLVIVLTAVSGVLLLATLSMCLAFIVMCRRKSSKSNVPQIDGTTVAVGRPVQGNAEAADEVSGTPVRVAELNDVKVEA